MQNERKFYELFYSLIRFSFKASLCDRESGFSHIDSTHVFSKDDLILLYNIAKKQSLLGICFIGIQRINRELPNICVNLSADLRMKWLGVSVIIQARNELIKRRSVELQTILKNNGFKYCILKGYGNVLNYPKDCGMLRQTGDIDVWLWCDGGLNQRRKKVIKFARSITPNAKAFYHHVDCSLFDDVEVELHYIPSWFNNPIVNRRFLKWCEMNAANQMDNKKDELSVPTLNFNLIYQLVHIFQHLFMEGIGLRQLMDYYMLLKNSNKISNKASIIETICYLRMEKFSRGIMWVLWKVFGLEHKEMLFEPDEKEGEFLLEEIELAGNFGKYDDRLNKNGKNLVTLFFMHIKRNFLFLTHYPSETLCSPLFKLWHWGWRSVFLNKSI